MTITIQQWLQQGEALYQNALKEFSALESQFDELEGRLLAKQAEINQIAGILGKPTVEASRRGTNGHAIIPAPVIPHIVEDSDRSQPAPSNANIARALTGRFGR